ncbi:penicillin-binding protein [Actinomyces sp. 2119]|uniref:Penicillin-binding protein n=1 Tax=Actinomyces lilanjuaniae TaxID=2321394 RepID=A0ABN5PLB3_9ACTO|nr:MULTISPECIES: transglycosylase domain-containing protein [Actinomyces]AYD88996.1 penicillin-binding protein [Actinomyces lilanjuaniae]RJF41152.1 penicillin-binding protein [Actinomyces sp. 2119]
MSKSSVRSRSLSPAQAVSMLLVLLLFSSAGGILTAGFAAPLVGASSALTSAAAQLFDELPSDFNVQEPSEVSVIKAADGSDIAQFYAENRIVVPLEDVSVNLQNAIVAVEDQRFYQHTGVDPTGIVRALVSNAQSDATQGGSTLTQQYVRNVLVEAGIQEDDPALIQEATEGTIPRKLREIKYALSLEQKYSKQQILEGYLNIAAFSPSTYGVEASAQHYFSHSAKEMTLAEAALMAGLTNAPSVYDPVTKPDVAKNRMEWVLNKMLEEEFITQEEYDEANATSVEDMLDVTDDVAGCGAAGNAAYFCTYVVNEILGSDLYGEDQAARRQLLLRGGLTITTTLDRAKQDAAYDSIQGVIPTGDPSQAKTAVVSVEPGTGRIVSMAQNTNFGDPSESDTEATQVVFAADSQHGGVQSAEGGVSGFQPGSSFKAFILAQWYQEGRSGYTTLNTKPRMFSASSWNISCAPELADSWTPKNVDSGLDGSHNVIDSTKHSINVGYAEMLNQMDVCAVTDLAASLGVTKTDGSPMEPRPSIVLGSQETPPLAMANAFATFAAHGVYCKPIAIDSILDTDGAEMAVPSADCNQVMDATAADKTAQTLTATSQSGGTAQTAKLSGRPTAGKTGTTDNNDNVWFVGFTPQLSTATWVGHSDGYRTLNNQYIGGRFYGTIYGSTLAIPIWKGYMEAALDGEPVQDFPSVNLAG